MTPIEKLGVEISDFLEQNALVWPNSLRQAWDAAKDAELDKESWAQICDQFDAENPHIGQAAEVAKLLRSNVGAKRRDAAGGTLALRVRVRNNKFTDVEGNALTVAQIQFVTN